MRFGRRRAGEMIAVDTNILVRYAVKDDLEQTAIATNFLALS
jgi:predicted nucleic-acid-binding protein